MRGLGSVLVPAFTLLAAAAVSGSCTATTGPEFPSGAEAVPPSFAILSVGGLPAGCTGQVYYESSTALCPPGLTYFLCDGISYTEYDCSNPGPGWSEETLSQYDRVATGPAACGTSPEGGPGSLNGTVYVEGNMNAPEMNSILVFRYCNGALPPLLVARYLTGGSGAADLYDRGILDADQQVTANADGTLLFAVNQGSDSIAAFHIGSDGLLTPVAGSPFASGGAAPASIGVSGNILIVANKAADGIRDLLHVAPNYTTFTIQTDGSLRPTGSKYSLAPGASPTQAFVAPGGKLVFGTEESGGGNGLGLMRAFQLSPSGELQLAAGSPLTLPESLFSGPPPTPVWPAGLSASATASVLYTGIPNNNSIAYFDFTQTGQLSVIGGESDPNVKPPSLPCWSVVSADGHRLYFANAGSDNVSVWDTETDPRQPRLLQTYELSGGGNPWGLRLDPTGQLLFVITPRQILQVPEGQGQLIHGLRLASDGTISDAIDGSPVTVPIPPDTNLFGLAVIGRL
jgi:DNA-binding beta-propeller fold protein YncE